MTKLLSTSLLACYVMTAAYTPTTHVQARQIATKVPTRAKFNTFHGIGIEAPDFRDIFERIQQVSPLARLVMKTNKVNGYMLTQDRNLKWTTMETNEDEMVYQVEKLEDFAGIPVPVFRFKCKLSGPLFAEFFGRFMIDVNERRKWDEQIETVYEMHSINDPELISRLSSEGYGKATRIGVGYGQSKASFGVTPREVLFVFGMHEFPDGSSLIWGSELPDEDNFLLPGEKRHVRARTHLFSAMIKPTGPDTFDVEYVVQADAGGRIPLWLQTRVLIESVKTLFQTIQRELKLVGANSSVQRFIQEKVEEEHYTNWQSLLIPV